MVYRTLSAFALIVTLTACEQPGAPSDPTIRPTGASQALFAAYPEHLFGMMLFVCQENGLDVTRATQDELRCEETPPPEAAAALILEYGGTVESLPRFVLSATGANTNQGYLVTLDNFVRVPQAAGGAVQLRLDDPALTIQMNETLAAAGGQPI